MISKKTPFKNLTDFYLKHEYCLVVLFILIWQFYLISRSKPTLSESDPFTHALRLVDFIQSGVWTEIKYMHDNYPFGQILHFTRITDMFLFLTSLPFLPFTDIKQAVFYGCFLYQPLMAALSAAGLIWAGKAFFGPILRILSLTFYFCPYPVLSLFIAGRADHHVLFNLLIIILLGNLMYGFKTQQTPFFKAAGLFAGLSVWVSPEGFLTSFPFVAGLLIGWIFKYQKLYQIKLFSLAFFITSLVCLIVNPPLQGLFFPDNGRLSVLLVTVMAFMTLTFYLEDFLEKESFISSAPGRLFSILSLAGLSFGFTVLLFGFQTICHSPIPPDLYNIWAQYMTELFPTFFSARVMFHFNAFPAVTSLLGITVFFLAPLKEKKAVALLVCPLIFFTLATFLSRRFGRNALVFSALLFPLVLHIIANKFSLFQKQKIRSAFKLLLIPYMLSCFFVLFLISYKIQYKQQTDIINPNDIADYISQEKGSILTFISRGPETAWGTGIPVVGSPYHSNVQGIADTHTLLHETNPDSVQKLLKKHRIKTILLDNPYYYVPKNRQKNLIFNPLTFTGKLFTQKNDFCFLKQIPDMPQNVKDKYLIFHVDFKACEK